MKLSKCSCGRFFSPCGDDCPATKPRKDREYLYSFDVRGKRISEPGAPIVWQWNREQLKATSMIEVSRLTKIKLDDLRFITKVKA